MCPFISHVSIYNLLHVHLYSYSDAGHMSDMLCNAIIDNQVSIYNYYAIKDHTPQLLPHNLPPISTIYILATYAHLLSNDVTKAETSVAMVTRHPIPLDVNTPLNEVLIYIIGLWYTSLAAVAKGDVKGCGDMTVTCLHVVNYVLSCKVSEDVSSKILQLKVSCRLLVHYMTSFCQQMLLNNLAIIAILEHRLGHAYQLLCNSIATNIGGKSSPCTSW